MLRESESGKRICILHIGAPKTGTTALQNFLTVNQVILKDHGLLYPVSNIRAMGHHDLAFYTGGGYPEWATPQEHSLQVLINKLADELESWTGDVVLSSENFYLLSDPVEVQNTLLEAGIVDNFTIKVLLYVRRQDEAHISWFNQIVKAQGFTGTLGESIELHHDLWDYDSRIARWCQVFGNSNIVIRPYQTDDLNNGDIRNDFLSLTGVTGQSFSWPNEASYSNTRINRDILEFQRLVNRLPLSPQEKRHFHKQLIVLTSETAHLGLFDDRHLMDNSRRMQILSSYAVGNARIAHDYLGRDRLFDEQLPKEVEAPEEGGDLTVEKLSYILGWLLARKI